MSGSPPLPPKSTPQETGDSSQLIYQHQHHQPPRQPQQQQPLQQLQQQHPPTSQDAHRRFPPTTRDVRLLPPGVQAHTPSVISPSQSQSQPQPQMRPFPPAPETPERMHYGFHRPPETSSRPLPPFQPQPPGHIMAQHPFLPMPLGSGPGPGPFSGPGQAAVGFQSPYSMPQRPPTQEGLPFTSPKNQRKTKGHVASACVPCKRAHLRCDAQRPCSRCITNSKEESCVDVQHKKRGRPRLRDDRELRYEPPGRGGHTQEGALRRPISLFTQPPTSMSPGFDDSIRRSQSYRVLKSQPTESGVSSRFLERGSAADANIYPAPLSIATRPPEPAAILTMDFDIAKASSTFAEAIGRLSPQGSKLLDVVLPAEHERLLSLQKLLHDRKEPNYLPPIFGKQEEERVIQGLGFTPDEMARFSLDRHEFLTFVGQDSQARPYPVRLGLAKLDSIYFVVLQLSINPRPHGHLTPSPHSRDPRDIPYQYQPVPAPSYAAQPTPVSATFDPGRPRLGSDASGGYGVRPHAQHMMPGPSPGLQSPYVASPNRPDYSPGLAGSGVGGVGPVGSSVPSYQIQRSELPPSSSTTRPPPPLHVPHAQQQQPGYQLPPIRSSQSQQQLQLQQPPPPPPPPPLHQQQRQSAGSSLPGEPSWSHQRDDRSRVDIGGLIDKPDPSANPQPRQR